MASPPPPPSPNVLLLRKKFEGDKKSKVPVTRTRSQNAVSEFHIASSSFTKSAGSSTRKFPGVNLPIDGGVGRVFVVVSSPPAGRLQRPQFTLSGSTHNQDRARSSSISSRTRKTSENGTVKSGGRSKDSLKKPPLPVKPNSLELEFRQRQLKRRSKSLGKLPTISKPISVKNDGNTAISANKDSDPALPESSQHQLEEKKARPPCVAERAKRFGGEDGRVKAHWPSERRPPDTGIKFGGVSSSKWDQSQSIDNEDHDEHDKRANTKGGLPATLEGSVIPLSQNPLLLQDELQVLEIQGRHSSLHNDILVTSNISNARGLFQKAQLKVSSVPSQTPAKPPVPDKPQILKKPQAATSGQNGRPNVSPKIDIPKRMEGNNIYDDVYPEAPSPPDTAIPKLNRSSKKLEKFFGEELREGGEDNSATTNVGKTKKYGKDKQSLGDGVRKTSRMEDMTDKDGPYAIIPIPDVDKTATKKPNTSDAKSRKISNVNGQPVLRNSGGMSSGDSGVLMHSDCIGQERNIRSRDRRMSRRILRKQMRSMDSDYAEDSDDEPIGTESDFDSDVSDDRLEDAVPEPIQFLDETHKKAYEVLTTERTYVQKLYLIDQIFFTRITQENRKHNWFPPTVPMEIFSNISTIYRLHSDVILCALEKQLKDWGTNPCLGEVLKDNAHFLKLYAYYVSNFNHAMKQLNLWTSKVPKFAAAISEMQKLPQCGGLALQHHMLTPVQRIPRYELLLKEYLRKLPEDARDRPSAEKALNIISGAAKHSNDMMKSMEQFEKLLKINEKIEGEDIIDPTRHLQKEGKITKIANKSKDPQDRYIYLFNDILLCCEKKRLLTASASYKVKLKLEVDGMKVSVLDSENCRFIIEGKTKSIELQTNTEEDREEWMAALLSAIREMVRKKESFKTNDAVGDRLNGVDDDEDDKFVPGKCEPRWIKDDETTMCMKCGTDFKLTKRRHHCRACGAVVCNKCSSYESALQYDNSKMNKVCFKCHYTLKGDFAELKKMERRSLITELGEEASFGSFLFLQKGCWVKYWVVMTDQDLYALKAPKDVRSVITIPIKLYTVSDVDAGSSDKEHVFKLTNGTDGRLAYTFAAESKEMKKRWITVLTNGLEEHGSKSQTI